MELLVTGFGPFGSIVENPSERLARSCGEQFEVIPVTYADAEARLEAWTGRTGGILMLGVHAGAEKLHVELFGRNQITTPDEAGQGRRGRIEPDGPRLVPATLWPRGLVRELADGRIRYSRSAGGYLCNYLSYRVLTRLPHLRAGFLHVPPFERIPEADQLEMLRKVIAAIREG